MLPQWLSNKESTCKEGDPGSILGLARSSGGGPGNPLHREAWRATVHGVAELDTTEATEHTTGLEPLLEISSCYFSCLSSRLGSFFFFSFFFLLHLCFLCFSLSFLLLPPPFFPSLFLFPFLLPLILSSFFSLFSLFSLSFLPVSSLPSSLRSSSSFPPHLPSSFPLSLSFSVCSQSSHAACSPQPGCGQLCSDVTVL